MGNCEILFDVQSICWNTAFVLGFIFFICGIAYLMMKKGITEEHFIKAGLFEFLASWIMYIPEELFNDIPDSLPALKILESICTALLRTFNIYLGNGYDRVAFDKHPVFSSVYATLLTVTNIVLLLFVAGFIIKFLDGPFQRIKISLRKRRYTYIFSSCNDKTLSIASSIKKKRINLIFACTNKTIDSEVKQAIDAIEGIYVDITVLDILRKMGKNGSIIFSM